MRQRIAVILILAVFSAGAAKDDVRQAETKYDTAARRAETVYRQAMLEAKSAYRNELNKAMVVATRAADLDTANKCKGTVNTLDQEIKDLQAANKPAQPAGRYPFGIKAACWGVDESWHDLTQYVVRRWQAEKPIDLNAIPDDPAPLRHKSMIIFFSFNGAELILNAGESRLRVIRADQVPDAVRAGNLKAGAVKADE